MDHSGMTMTMDMSSTGTTTGAAAAATSTAMSMGGMGSGNSCKISVCTLNSRLIVKGNLTYLPPQDALELEHDRFLLPLVYLAHHIHGNVRGVLHWGDPIDHVP